MNENNFLDDIIRHIDSAGPFDLLIKIIIALVSVIATIAIFNILQVVVGKLLKKRLSPQRTFVIKKSIKYTGFVMAILLMFRSLGLDSSALLGAAGVIGIAVGFASQTTVASCISGFLLLSEKPFEVGDAIMVDTILGVVLSVDILSVKIRTFDNLYMRIPNETLFKSNVINLSRFPVRRLDLMFNVTYQADLEKVKETLLDIANKNPYVLDNPAPIFRVDQFDRSGPAITFNVWFDKSQLLETRTSMYMAIQKRFAEERIELPYQKVDVTMDSQFARQPEKMAREEAF